MKRVCLMRWTIFFLYKESKFQDFTFTSIFRLSPNLRTVLRVMTMRVLVSCEESGVVRRAFALEGHFAVSVDLLPARDLSPNHYQGDIFHFLDLNTNWDLMIAHPPCTHLSVSGAAHFKNKVKEQAEALEFVQRLMDLPIPKICIENPVSVISSKIRKPDQIIQPYEFGHDASKKTCLWLKNLPLLVKDPAKFVHPSKPGKDGKLVYANQTPSGQNNLGPGKDRAKLRSETYAGIAEAMAEQWGS